MIYLMNKPNINNPLKSLSPLDLKALNRLNELQGYGGCCDVSKSILKRLVALELLCLKSDGDVELTDLGAWVIYRGSLVKATR